MGDAIGGFRRAPSLHLANKFKLRHVTTKIAADFHAQQSVYDCRLHVCPNCGNYLSLSLTVTVCLSVCLYQSVSVSVCLPACLCLSLCLFVCLCLSFCIINE